MLLESPRFRTKRTMGDRSFMVATPVLWNNLFLPIRQAETLILLNVYLRLKYIFYIYRYIFVLTD